MAKNKKITLANLYDMTPEDLLNNFPYTKENKEHLQKIFNDEKYDDEDYFDECYKLAEQQLQTEKKKNKKKSYNVTLYFHTNLSVYVEAESEKEAIELARAEAERECYTQDLLNGLQEDGCPDAVEDND